MDSWQIPTSRLDFDPVADLRNYDTLRNNPHLLKAVQTFESAVQHYNNYDAIRHHPDTTQLTPRQAAMDAVLQNGF